MQRVCKGFAGDGGAPIRGATALVAVALACEQSSMVWYRFGDFVFDTDAFVLRRADEMLPLQPKVRDVLRYLIEHRGRMVARTELLDQLWRSEDVNEAVITWSISHIRRALGQHRGDKHPIETVHGRGYRFTAEVEAVATPARTPATAEPRLTVLVGRKHTMAELQQCAQDAAAGLGTLCVVTGESGIGKTRCAEELAACAPMLGLHPLVARCPRATGTPPLWPIDAALREAGGPPSGHIRRAIAELGALDEPQPASGAAARFRIIEAIAKLLRDLAAERPTLLILDDLQWADDATLQLLGFVAPELHDTSLCIVATLTDGERETGGPRDRALLHVLRHARTIPLGPLNGNQVGGLVAAMVGYRPGTELTEAVRRASGGLPLFVHEVVRALLREHGRDALDRLGADAVNVPSLARDLLRERIQQLPPATFELLSRAAVIGESFELSLLARLLEIEPEALLDRLAPALADRLLESEAPHIYRFAHSMFQSELYAGLPPGQRVAIHRRIGELLKERGDRDAQKAAIARHYYFSLAAGAPDEVTRWAQEAGEAAARALAFDDAVRCYTWALEAQVSAGVADARARAQLLLSLAGAQRSAGRTGDAMDTSARVIEIAQQHRMHDLIVGATRLRRPTVALATLPDTLARSALEGVLRQLPESGEPHPVRISALSQLACVPPYDRDLARSKEWSARAVALAERQESREVLFEALRARLFALSGPDDVDVVLRVSERMLALEREGSRSWQAMDARVARFSALLLAGRIDEADEALAVTEAALRGPHWGEATFYCQRMRAQRRFLDGHFAEAEQLWKGIFDRAARVGVSYADQLRDAQVLNLELEREGPSSVFERHLRVAHSSLARVPRALRFGVARIAAQAGRLTFVRSELAALGDPSDYVRDGVYLHSLASLSLCAVAIGDKARCEQLMGLLSPYAERNTPDLMGYYLGSVSYFLGLLAAVLGRVGHAQACLDQALEHNRAMRYRAGVVRTWMALGELAARSGQQAPARAAFRAARSEAQSLGMRAAAAAAESALAGSS